MNNTCNWTNASTHMESLLFDACTQNVVLILMLCTFTWTAGVVSILIQTQPTFPVPKVHGTIWSTLCIMKLLLIGFLVVIKSYTVAIAGSQVAFEILSSIILLLTYCFSGFLIVWHRYHYIHTSWIQLLFWMVLSSYQALLSLDNHDFLDSLQRALSSMLAMLFCIADYSTMNKETNLCPALYSSSASLLFFSWAGTFVSKSSKGLQSVGELWDILPSLKSSGVFETFNKTFRKQHSTQARSPTRNILAPLWSVVKLEFTVGVFLRLASTLTAFLTPFVMKRIISVVEDKNADRNTGIIWAAVLFLICFIVGVLLEHSYNKIYKCCMNVSSALTMAIYRKSLNLSSQARKYKTTGEMVNLMSVDVHNLDLCGDLSWTGPLEIAVGLVLLWNELGYSMIPGISVIIGVMPVTWWLSSKLGSFQGSQMTRKDDRLKLISEVLSGMETVKLYAWEPTFYKEIEKIRRDEIDALRRRSVCQSGNQFVVDSVPFLVSLAAFFTYIYFGEGTLDAKKAFSAVILFNLITDPISQLPASVTLLIDARVSLRRINDFLNAEENPSEDSKELSTTVKGDSAVEIVKGTFSWECTETCLWKLDNINLRVPKGSLIALVGSVAAGKSSILSAILGDMRKSSGVINVNGTIAYVPQVAWILNTSLRENICFGMPYAEGKFREVVKCCCLEEDISNLPAGDMTEIGENGVNLSGGQKQRVALARAVYSGADIYLLDDVLSSVDNQVGKLIFDRLLGPDGLLKEKTRILATHSNQYLTEVDEIVLIDDGAIIDKGNYADLVGRSEIFVRLTYCATREKVGETKLDTRDKFVSVRKNSPNSQLVQTENLQTGRLKKSVFLQLLQSMGKSFVAVFFVFFGLSETLSLCRNIVLTKWTSLPTNLSNTDRIAHSSNFAIEYSLLGMGQCIFFFLGYSLATAICTLKVSKILHNQMLQRILHAPMRFFHTTPIGRITNRFSSDVGTIDNLFPYFLGEWLVHLFKFLGILFTIAYATKIYFLICLIPISLCYIYLQRNYVACMRQLDRLKTVQKSPIFAQFQETLQGTSTIRAFQAETRFIQMLSEKMDEYNRVLYPHMIVRRWISIRLGYLGSVLVGITALFAVIWRDGTNSSMVGLGLSYAVQVTVILSWLVKVTSYMQNSIVSIERILEYSEIDQEAEFNNDLVELSPGWPAIGNLKFVNYETKYRTELDTVLKQINCNINGGDKVGIVGRTGAGKSSLVQAIFRMIEATQGEIQIDGVNIAHIGLHRLRRRLTVIPQDPVIFSKSIRFNLDPFETHTDDELWRSLEMASLSSFVKDFNGGLDFELSEGGNNLSGGQRQLICLARAILKKSKIIVLDEATASVDNNTDKFIQEAVREYFKGCTILNIAHRLNTVMDSDQILVLNDGRVVEYGSPPESETFK